MNSELWKKIEGYDYYEVSNLGNIRSLDRIVVNGRKFKGKNLKPRTTLSGNKSFIVTDKYGHQSTKYIHQEMAKVFLQDYDARKVVTRVDGNPLNLNVDNLRMDSRSENYKENTRTSRFKGFEKKLDCGKVEEIKEKHSLGTGKRELAIEFNVSITTITRVISNKRWKNTET